jgi:hypothetical protein
MPSTRCPSNPSRLKPTSPSTDAVETGKEIASGFPRSADSIKIICRTLNSKTNRRALISNLLAGPSPPGSSSRASKQQPCHGETPQCTRRHFPSTRSLSWSSKWEAYHQNQMPIDQIRLQVTCSYPSARSSPESAHSLVSSHSLTAQLESRRYRQRTINPQSLQRAAISICQRQTRLDSSNQLRLQTSHRES